MKQYIIFSLLALLTSASIVAAPTQNAYSQGTTGLSAMTMVSFGNGNSTVTSNLQPIENKTVTYFGGNTSGYLVYPNQNQTNEMNQNTPKIFSGSRVPPPTPPSLSSSVSLFAGKEPATGGSAAAADHAGRAGPAPQRRLPHLFEPPGSA